MHKSRKITAAVSLFAPNLINMFSPFPLRLEVAKSWLFSAETACKQLEKDVFYREMGVRWSNQSPRGRQSHSTKLTNRTVTLHYFPIIAEVSISNGPSVECPNRANRRFEVGEDFLDEKFDGRSFFDAGFKFFATVGFQNKRREIVRRFRFFLA